MLFLFKKKKIVLDCFTIRPYVYEYSKVDYAQKFFPQWWKDIPKYHHPKGQLVEHSTMKYCTGFIEQFKHGLIIPLWSDLAVEIGPINEQKNKYRYQFGDNYNAAIVHPEYQRGDYLPDTHYQHLKLACPWEFKCNKDIKWQFMMNPYLFEDIPNFFMIPGILDYKYQYGTNINVIFKRTKEYQKFRMNIGQPLVQVIPLTEEPFEIRYHLIDEKEHEKMFGHYTKLKFHNLYKNFKKITKEKEAQEKSKCPFHR